MSEAYQHKEHELRSAIDNINCINYIFEDYVKETNYFIDRLLEDTKEINILRRENKRLNNIINEFEKWLDEESEKTILSTGHLTCLMMCKNKLQKLKGSDKE